MNGPCTSVAADAVLSEGSCSASRPATTAVFVIVPAVRGRTMIVIVTSSLNATEPMLHVTASVPEHVPFVEATETSVTSEGSESVTTTPLAVSPFLFVTVNV